MYRAAFTAALLVSSFPLVAQNQSSTDPPTSTIYLANLSANAPFADGCPVSMNARQGIWDHTIRVRNGQDEKTYNGFGQRITLTLDDRHSSPIVAA